MSYIISLDTETTGVDLRHGALPFFVTICYEDGRQVHWEWPVNPLTRMVSPDGDDMQEIRDIIERAEFIVLQNSKFDVTALTSVGLINENFPWDWSKTHDTLIASHVLNSAMPHNLTALALQYLGVDINPYEERLEQACKAARRWCRTRHKDWRIAKEGLPEMPSAKSSQSGDKDRTWKYDSWLPRAVCLAEERDETDPWWSALEEYANMDTAVTLPLWQVMEKELRAKDLWEYYLCRLRAMPLAYDMERRGITISGARLNQLAEQYGEEARNCEAVCYNIANDYGYTDLVIPNGGRNQSLERFLFDVMRLERRYSKKAKSDAPTLNKEAMQYYLDTLPAKSRERMFIVSLLDRRSRQTAVSYMAGYQRFWKHLDPANPEYIDWYLLHPSLNPTGTGTLRWSSSQPNEQNISKREGFNLRYCFGPAPGWEWWSLDAKNIELRIPAYESNEQAFIELFEHENDAPYFGSNHLLISHLLHKKLFEECYSCSKCQKEIWCKASTTKQEKCCSCTEKSPYIDGRVFKKRYASTWYQWVKNGNFSVQYGSIDREDGTGTADRAYHLPGAQALIKARFTKQDALNQKWIKFAEKHGYVETIPDQTVNPRRGYPIMCTRTEWGKILPTVPLNYHVQSTAMWWTHKGSIRVEDQLEQWRVRDKFQGYLCMQVHDELVFAFPKTLVDPREDLEREKAGKGINHFSRSNLWRIRVIQRLMEQGGRDIGVPTPVGVEFHPNTWSEGITL